jgi:hypothetical protein
MGIVGSDDETERFFLFAAGTDEFFRLAEKEAIGIGFAAVAQVFERIR